MITLPPGFDIDTLIGDFTDLCEPFIEVAVLICAFIIVAKIFRRG